MKRVDDGKAALTVSKFNDRLRQLKLDTINNDNITAKDLGKRGLHMKEENIGKLAINLVKKFRSVSKD